MTNFPDEIVAVSRRAILYITVLSCCTVTEIACDESSGSPHALVLAFSTLFDLRLAASR